MKYYYVGPILRFDRVYVDNWNGGCTEAKSVKQAALFFSARAKRYLDLTLDSKVNVDPNRIFQKTYAAAHKVYKPETKKISVSAESEEQLTFSFIGTEKWK